MNVLLLENRFKKKYRNLGLMKFRYITKIKIGMLIFSGIDKRNTLKDAYDEIIFFNHFYISFEDDIKLYNIINKNIQKLNLGLVVYRPL